MSTRTTKFDGTAAAASVRVIALSNKNGAPWAALSSSPRADVPFRRPSVVRLTRHALSTAVFKCNTSSQLSVCMETPPADSSVSMCGMLQYRHVLEWLDGVVLECGDEQP